MSDLILWILAGIGAFTLAVVALYVILEWDTKSHSAADQVARVRVTFVGDMKIYSLTLGTNKLFPSEKEAYAYKAKTESGERWELQDWHLVGS